MDNNEKEVIRDTVRVNVTISNELKQWYTDEAKSYGCSVSSMMAIALAQYKQGQEGISSLKDMSILIEKLRSSQLSSSND